MYEEKKIIKIIIIIITTTTNIHEQTKSQIDGFILVVKDTNYFINFLTNGWCDNWLLVSKKIMLIVSSDNNQ